MEYSLEYLRRLQATKNNKELEAANYTVSPHFKGWVVFGHVHFVRNQFDTYHLPCENLQDAVERWFDEEAAKKMRHACLRCCGNICQKRLDTFMVMFNIRTNKLKAVRLNSSACRLHYQDVYNWWVHIRMPGTHDSENGEGMWTWWNKRMDRLS